MSMTGVGQTAARKQLVPWDEFRMQLDERDRELMAALPAHVSVAHFKRVAITAVQHNPELMNVERRSLFNALMKCAQDGLLPDGREAALVVFNVKDRGKIAQYLMMVGGVRKLVQQSGEITRFEQQLVYAADLFDYQLGDNARIEHKPALKERGPIIAVYSIAEYRNGARSREVMTYEDVEKVRAVSRSADGPAWSRWWGEMARKTVAKRHAKSLPMSNDLDSVLARDDGAVTFAPNTTTRRLPTRDALDRLADQDVDEAQTIDERPRRGRPRKHETPPADAAPDPGDELPPPPDNGLDEHVDQTPPATDDELRQDVPQSAMQEFGQLMPDETQPDPDYQRGMRDKHQGRASCLDRDISADPQRMARWKAGFAAAGR